FTATATTDIYTLSLHDALPISVTLQDLAPERISPAIKRASELYGKRLKQPHLVQAAMDRLVPDVKGDGVAKADLVIEAIVENARSEEHTSELQSLAYLVCRLLL